MDINNTISKLYNNAGFMQKYGGQLYITGLIIFVFSIGITYVNVLNHTQHIKKNWSHERCNPFIIPLAGWINNTNKKTESNYKYTIDNFEFCLSSYVKTTFSYLIDTFKHMLTGLYDVFMDILNIISGVINYFMSIENSLFSILENAWGLALQATVGMQELLNKSRDSFNRIIGVVITVLYTQMLLFRMSILWMITTPIFMIFTMVTNILVDLLMTCIRFQIKIIVMWTMYIVCAIKSISACLATTGGFYTGLAAIATFASGVASDIAGTIMEAAGVAIAAIPFQEATGAAMEGAGIAMEEVGVGEETVAVGEGATATAEGIFGLSLSTSKMVGCGVNIMSKAMMVILIIAVTVQITALTVIIYLLFVCLHFVKVTLGQMNIPGQGIPGISF